MMGEPGRGRHHCSGILREVPVPWRESSPMSERLAFIQACLDRRERITTICDRFGISEKTGHKWLARFRAAGPAGLEARSHAPHAPAHQITEAVRAVIVDARKAHPLYGAAKLRDWLTQRHPEQSWPAASWSP